MDYHITVDSFGADIPSNWEDIASCLNAEIDRRGIAEDHDAVNDLWEAYWNGEFPAHEFPAPKELRVPTAVGTLIVKDANDKTYPGVNIYFERNGKKIILGIFELKFEEPDVPIFSVHVYDAVREHEDPIFDEYLTMEEIDAYWKGDDE